MGGPGKDLDESFFLLREYVRIHFGHGDFFERDQASWVSRVRPAKTVAPCAAIEFCPVEGNASFSSGQCLVRLTVENDVSEFPDRAACEPGRGNGGFILLLAAWRGT